MKVLISVDIEGVSGAVALNHTASNHSEYQRFRKIMTAEANAAIEGALAGGADQIVVNDSHGSMTNILIEELNPVAELISGSPKPFGMMQGIGEDIDAVMLIGYHASAGTSGAVISHTNTGSVQEVRLNGQVVGEAGFNAAVAGAYGAPVVLVAGDRAVTEEVRELLGADVETVAVKEGITWTSARCLNPEVTRKRIREAAERALSRPVKPYIVQPPITVRATFQLPIHGDMAALVPGSRRLDGCTLEWTGPDMQAVHAAFRAMTGLVTLSQMQMNR